MTAVLSGTGHDALFAHGRIAVLQQMLLTRPDVDRLLGAHDAREVARIFTELKLSSRIDQGIADPDRILDAIAAWVRDEVETMAPEKFAAVFDILWLEGDVPLLAFLLKERLGLTSAVSHVPTPAITAYSPELWKTLVVQGQSDTLPVSAVSCIQEVIALENPTPALIDARAAQWGATRQLELAKQSGSSLIVAFVRHAIDLQNIRIALRSLNIAPKERKSMLLPGGTLPHESFLGTRSDLLHAVRIADMGFVLTGDVAEDDHQQLEHSLSAVTAADIAALWNVPLSIEPIFAFAALTLSHVRLLRALLLAKRAGFSPQDAKRILPPFLPTTHYIS